MRPGERLYRRLQKARNGEDPSADKKAAKAALSVGQLIDHYLADGPATKPAKRASTSLFLVGKLLGHASARTTERYAHLSGAPLKVAVTSIGRDIMGADR
jgi:hypothetical protein